MRMWSFKKSSGASEKKKSAIIDKMLRSLAEQAHTRRHFEDFECETCFRGYEKAKQNQVRLKEMVANADKNVDNICSAIERTEKSFLSAVAIDFYGRHICAEDRKFKEGGEG